jgi:hypothetical protein
MTATEIRNQAKALNLDLTGLDLRKKADKEKAIFAIYTATQRAQSLKEVSAPIEADSIQVYDSCAIDQNPAWEGNACRVELEVYIDSSQEECDEEELVNSLNYWDSWNNAYNNATRQLQGAIAASKHVVVISATPATLTKENDAALVGFMVLAIASFILDAVAIAARLVFENAYIQQAIKKSIAFLQSLSVPKLELPINLARFLVG